MIRRSLWAAVSLAIGLSASARADLVIDVPTDAIIHVDPTTGDGTASVNVIIHASSGTEYLNTFSLGLLIQPSISNQGGFLNFPTQTDDELGNPGYVFYMNSAGQDFPPMPPAPGQSAIGQVVNSTSGSFNGTDSSLNDQFNATDSTNDFSDVPISSTSSSLLLTLNLQIHNASVGDTFTIGLASSYPTTFYDANGTVGFSFNAGLVTVEPNAVPEPGSMALLGLGLPIGAWWNRRRRKHTGPALA